MTTESLYKSPAGERAVLALYDAVLAHWPVAHATVILPTRHGDTFVIASGDPLAPPLILLHGSASNAAAWVGEVAEYSASFRVYAPDLPGEPGKSAPNRPAWDGPGYAEWLEDVLDGLAIQKTALLGISQGGWTALRFATARPERVAKLVLLTPGGVAPTRPGFIVRAVFFSMLGRWGAARLNQIVFGRQAIAPEAVEFMNIILTHFKARVGREYLFTDDDLKRLDMPVLVLGGTEDAIRSMEAVEARLRPLVPKLEAVRIPGAGHVLINTAGCVIPFLRPEASNSSEATEQQVLWPG